MVTQVVGAGADDIGPGCIRGSAHPTRQLRSTGTGFVNGAQVEANGTQLQTTSSIAGSCALTVPTYLLAIGPDARRWFWLIPTAEVKSLTLPVGNSGPSIDPQPGLFMAATQVAGGPFSPGQVLVIYGFPTTSSSDIGSHR